MRSTFQLPRLTSEQEKEGYWVGDCEGRVLVWHKKDQIALLCKSLDIKYKVQEVVEKEGRTSKKGKQPGRLTDKLNFASWRHRCQSTNMNVRNVCCALN
jgi:hypothetical protein